MRFLTLAAAALALSACAPIANTSSPIIARVSLNQTTIGGIDYPVVISGAEAVGLSPDVIAGNLQFPPNLRGGSSFRAVAESPNLINHAHLDIRPSGNNATSTLTFLHGDKRTGVGTFTLTRDAYANPRALGSTSASLIGSMLDRAAQIKADDDKPLILFR